MKQQYAAKQYEVKLVKTGKYKGDIISVSYPLKTIGTIIHSKFRNLYSPEDIRGNGVKPNDSAMMITFKDGTTATFGSDWVMTIE